jgi:fermentation-respiration switch protein FrsA (DUF1100 family)
MRQLPPLISAPTLLLHGLKDDIVSVNASVGIYNNLGSTSKALVQIDCASHALLWEGCSGPTCSGWGGPHESVISPYVRPRLTVGVRRYRRCAAVE